MTNARHAPSPLLAIAVVASLLAGAGWAWFTWSSAPDDALVVYCAHDSLYSEEILREFERQTGQRVSIRFDTEATKSLGLVNLLIREQEHPRCDVFWNNQVLGTVTLQEAGLLAPYQGPGFERIPAGHKDSAGHWAGFAGRLRVYILNTDKLAGTDAALETALAGDLSQAAIAKPMFGTTLSHYAVLWHEWGAEKLQEWHRDIHRRGVREAPGNAAVKNLVAEGVCEFGWTDTDDYYIAKDAGKPVAMLPVRVAGQTICIPNSVAIIKGTRRPEAARRLVDFLLSAETELRLARSAARQVPLGPVDEAQLSDEVRQLKNWAADAYPLASLGKDQADCLRWLEAESVR